MKTQTKRTLLRALACGFLLTAAAQCFPFAASCEALPQNVVRLHVVAHSDSPADQSVKLKVRDAVLQEASRWYRGADSMEEASASLCLHLGSIQKAADRALAENGCSQKAAVQVTDMYFPTRDYGDLRLPAGKYRTLRVTLGAGKGKNWWCVVFPALCLPAAGDREEALALLPGDQRDLVEHPQEYQVKFKVIELYEELKSWFDH